jgi:two-component system chemotaxis sensor kinase CheA
MSVTDEAFMQELRREFLNEASFLLEECEASYLSLDRVDGRGEELGKIFRCAHSLKGAGAAVGFLDLSHFAHAVEDLLSFLRNYPEKITQEITSVLLKTGDAFKVRVAQLKTGETTVWDVSELEREVRQLTAALVGLPESGVSEKPKVTPEMLAELESVTRQSIQEVAPSGPEGLAAPAATHPAQSASPSPQSGAAHPPSGSGGASSVKVDTDRIDGVLDLIGELVVIKSQLINETSCYATNLRLNGIVSLLDKTVRDLQGRALSMRMTGLKPLFMRLQRTVRDTALKVGKPIEFVMHGEETEIDRTMIELLADPLMHIVRNSVDHGIEKAMTRKNSGKSEQGRISVRARQAGGRVVVEVQDDGGGINRDKVFLKAFEKGLTGNHTSPDTMKDSELYQLIFSAGFSTAETVSDISGRGVGLDVVRSNIEKLKGSIEIESKPGAGTSFRISIPLTTSITDGMLAIIEGNRYIIPMDRIRELVHMRDAQITEVTPGNRCVEVRGRSLPLAHLDGIDELDRSEEGGAYPGGGEMLVVTDNGQRPFAFQVDRVIGQSQVVLKSLGPNFKQNLLISGAAVMGDGRVALVLDIDGMASREMLREAS